MGQAWLLCVLTALLKFPGEALIFILQDFEGMAQRFGGES